MFERVYLIFYRNKIRSQKNLLDPNSLTLKNPKILDHSFPVFSEKEFHFLVACYATLQPAMSVGRSVGQSVGRSVGRSPFAILGPDDLCFHT